MEKRCIECEILLGDDYHEFLPWGLRKYACEKCFEIWLEEHVEFTGEPCEL